MGLTANSLALYRNLVNANHVFFVSPLHTYQKAKYDALMRQSAGRALRLMQTRKVHIYMCIVLKTVDVDILEMRTSSRLLQRSGPADADSESTTTTPRPHHPHESEDQEMQDAYDATIVPQGTKRKRNVAAIDDTDNVPAKRTRNARNTRLPSPPTDQMDVDMDDEDAALARQLQADHDTQATDAAIAEQIQNEEYQATANEHPGDDNAKGNTTYNHGRMKIRWDLKHTALLTEAEKEQRWGTGFQKAPDEHEFE